MPFKGLLPVSPPSAKPYLLNLYHFLIMPSNYESINGLILEEIRILVIQSLPKSPIR
jgi:hypothetical protein